MNYHKYKRLKSSDKPKPKVEQPDPDGLIRLNKYIANSGVCSRREADILIETGAVKVNGKIVNQLGAKVKPTDSVEYGGQKIRNEKNVYLLLNKPKDYITTMDDPEGRHTVMELVRDACRERIYPVGRLDRNTTGLLLFTNDGDLTKKLTHPSHKVKKVYHVIIDRKLNPADMQKIIDGVQIEEHMVKVDSIGYYDKGDSKRELTVELHSGQNRIVRKIFESLDYKVEKLDRLVFAGLTKRDLMRGKWRFLTPKEIAFLKMGNYR